MPPKMQWTRQDPALPKGNGRKALRGRHLADNSEPIAVLLIGMRVNKWHKVTHWVPVMRAMLRMLRELVAEQDGALLGYRILWGPVWGETTVIQYWKRAGDIRAFSHNPEQTHSPAEVKFRQRFEKSKGAVGIWHEMLSVRAGAYQCLYGDMRPMGIGAIRGVQPAVAHGSGRGYEVGEDPELMTAIARSTS